MVKRKKKGYYRATFQSGKLKLIYHVEGVLIDTILYPSRWKVNKVFSNGKALPLQETFIRLKGGRTSRGLMAQFRKTHYNIRKIQKNPFQNA